MRACVLAVLIPVLFVPESLPQCNVAPRFSAQFRSTFHDVVVDGTELWTATGYGVAVYDRGADPPTLIASLAIPGTTRVVRVASNGTAYAGSGSSIVTIQKNGRALQIAKSVDAGAQVNDLLVRGGQIYAATSDGLLQFDLFDWSKRTLPTSGKNVQSLALLGNTTLYAADGDSSVEAFNIDIPSLVQSVGSFTSLPRVTSVEVNNGKLFASDGRQTQLFAGSGAAMTKIGDAPFGVTSLAPIAGEAVFVAASDRAVNAFDFATSSTPVGLFTTSVPPSLGTVNRVLGLAATTTRLYAAAGDAGLLTFDVGAFNAPYPLHGYPTAGAVGSIVSVGDKVYVPRGGGGITEYGQSAAGALTQQRSWGDKAEVLLDGGDNFVLSASGSTLSLWNVFAAPTLFAIATFPAAVQSGVLRGLTAYAVLADHTLWSADLSGSTPLIRQIALSVKPSSIARSGTSLAIAELRSDGTTTVVFFRDGEFAAATSANVAGVATAPIVLDGATAALFTYRGINLIDFSTGSVTVIPQSNGAIARALALGGSTVLELTDSELLVWNTAPQRLVKELTIPGDPAAMSWPSAATQNVADIATDGGIVTVALSAVSRMPSQLPASNPNSFYKKVVAGGGRVVLFDSRGADIFTTAMHFAGSARAAGMVDVAVSPAALYALFANRTIAKYTVDGLPLSQTTINDAPDTVPLAIFAVGDAVWVSVAKSCSSGCQKSTLIYNAALSQTATLAGAAVDVAVAGTRTYALFDTPSEVRAYEGTTQIATHAVEGSPAPVSISATGDAVYVLGEKLYAYATSDLHKLGEQLSSYTNVPGSPVTFVDQHVRAANGCGIVSGRAADAALYATAPGAWTPATQFPAPSTVRSLAQLGSAFYLLTDHSLEIWSSAPMPPPPRRKAAR